MDVMFTKNCPNLATDGIGKVTQSFKAGQIVQLLDGVAEYTLKNEFARHLTPHEAGTLHEDRIAARSIGKLAPADLSRASTGVLSATSDAKGRSDLPSKAQADGDEKAANLPVATEDEIGEAKASAEGGGADEAPQL